MTLSVKGIFLLIAIGLTITAGLTLADEPTEADSAPDVTAISDTTMTVFARAIAGQDSALLVSVFPEDIQIAMPEGKSIVGQEKVAKYTPLLFEMFGGCEMTYKRLAIEPVAKYDDIVRDVGTVEFARHADKQVDMIWNGAYTIYWRLTDSTWTMERIFVGRRER